jgi:diadenosine tetraphosphatase ApaH/serine/threonine PP2A family protein phosphatase
VLADLARQGASEILCLGDIVGYGPEPGAVLDRLVPRLTAAVTGNHDRAASGLLDLAWFNEYARRAAEWTAERLSVEETRYLAGLPLVARHGDATLVHASPLAPDEWPYVVDHDEGAAALAAVTTPVCFIGHSHVPAAWLEAEDGGVDFRPGGGRVALGGRGPCLVNVGSVGQPRDGDPMAAYGLWDPEAGTVEIRRVPYDVHEARRRLHAAGLPRLLGDRLLDGR